MKKTSYNKDIHSYIYVHDENSYKNNMDSHSYKDVHDEKPIRYGYSFVQRCA